jgi:hypothetical protein
MTAQSDAQLASTPSADPIAKRVAMCLIWLAAYGLTWWFVVFRPLPHVAWVNLAVIGAILLGTLPPARIRPFTAAAALLALAAIMELVINNTLYAIVLGLWAMFALTDGIMNFRGRRSTQPRA